MKNETKQIGKNQEGDKIFQKLSFRIAEVSSNFILLFDKI